MKPLIAGFIVTSFFAGSVHVERPEVLFTVGTVYVYKGESSVKGGRNLKYTEYVKIEKVDISGVQMLSTGTLRYEFENTGNMDDPGICKFACDTVNYYIHTTNYSFQTVDDLKKGTMKVTGDSIIYPLKMKVGDTLPNAKCKTVRSLSSGTSTTVVTYTNRKVEGLDTLNLNCGKIVAYRITSLKTSQNKSNSNYTGKIENTDEENWTEWFSPLLGVVKAVNKSDRYNEVVVLESYSK